ncbi:MAG: FtsQ-type POTRA domain-containing protein, partial [Clostridia bacterium]|nr:FtsQ-type POTRA domain-containing protein [Clostridia bacterium]
NPLYDEYGNPLYDTTELYDENGDPIADGAEYDAEPLFTPEYDDDDYTLYETGEDEAAPEAEPRTNHKGTRIYGHIPTGSDEEDPYAAPEDGFDLGDDDAPEFENEVEESGSSIPEPETIRLFGTDADAETAQRFRKGSSSNVRVQLNETEMSRAVEAAHRKTKENRDRKQAEKERVRSKRRETIEAFIRRSAANFVFGLAIFIALLAAGYFMFLITDIRITGTTRTYTDDEIRGLTGISKRQHILLVDLEEVREHITANPYMQVNKIEYVFPARIRIDLTERTEAAAIVGLDYNVIIDENGYVLSMTSAGSGGLVQITGVSMSGFKLGQRIGESSDFTTASLISIIAKLKEYNLTDKIRSVDMTTPLAIVMYTRNGFKIHVGQPTDLDSKFTTLSQALPRAEAAHCYTGTLYLSAKGGAVYSPPGAEESALQNATQDANAIRLGSGYEYGMYTAPDAQGNIVPQQSYSTSNGAQGGVPQSTAPAVPDTPDDFQG